MTENSLVVPRPYRAESRGAKSYLYYPLAEQLYVSPNESLRKIAYSVFPPVDLSQFGVTTVFRPGPDFEEAELFLTKRLYTLKYLTEGEYPMFFPNNRMLCAVVAPDSYPRTHLYLPALRRRILGTRGTLQVTKEDDSGRLEIPYTEWIL